jgi:hypothetical protein
MCRVDVQYIPYTIDTGAVDIDTDPGAVDTDPGVSGAVDNDVDDDEEEEDGNRLHVYIACLVDVIRSNI